MSPDFGDLVGRDIEEGERARLEHVHDLLVAAGPPPEYVVAPPAQLRPRRRRAALLAIAAALAVASFAAGAAVVDHWGGPNVDFTVTMTGTASATNATGSLVVFDIDAAGNWPMKLTVDGLPAPTGGKTFELWLTRDGKLAALCGSFLTADGSAVVPLNAPYRFDEYDGWIVVQKGSDTPLLTT